MGSHSVTCHPAFTPAEAGTWFNDPGGMQGWVDLCYVKADRPGIEPATGKLQLQCPTTWAWSVCVHYKHKLKILTSKIFGKHIHQSCCFKNGYKLQQLIYKISRQRNDRLHCWLSCDFCVYLTNIHIVTHVNASHVDGVFSGICVCFPVFLHNISTGLRCSWQTHVTQCLAPTVPYTDVWRSVW